jgi:hypothetical protein
MARCEICDLDFGNEEALAVHYQSGGKRRDGMKCDADITILTMRSC